MTIQPTKNQLIDIDFHVAERCDYYPCKKNVIKSQQLMQIISEKYPDLILNKVANVIVLPIQDSFYLF